LETFGTTTLNHIPPEQAWNAGALAMRDALLRAAENVCFRPTQDERVSEKRIRCSVTDLLVKLASVHIPEMKDE
jgi:hypothetical protein